MRRPANLLNGIDLVTLRILLAAQEERNLARVAERENIAISAVSRRIAEFEQRYGFTVFDRHDRGVTPTPDGAKLLARVLVVIGELLSRYRLDTPAGWTRPEPETLVAVHPRGGMPLRLTPADHHA